jgi:hypothetical protein
MLELRARAAAETRRSTRAAATDAGAALSPQPSIAQLDQLTDHAYYQHAAERLGGNRACLAVARKLLKRSYLASPPSSDP